MYLELFDLKELPFRLNPDPEFLYLSKAHARAKAYMESTIWFTDGFVVITGEIGSGKTTLIETFLGELAGDVVVAQINQTQVSASEFLQAVLVQFGFTPFQMKKAELLATLNQFLGEQHEAGRKVMLIVDEAQNLGLRVLEEIRMLSGVDTTKDRVLRIILAGQPELNEKLDAPELLQLVQRVRLRFHLPALTLEDTEHYVQHRLEVAGSQGREIFQPDCYPTIYRFTGGVPRLINTLCDTAMLSAYNADRNRVSPADIDAAAQELQWVEFARRSAASRPAREARGATAQHAEKTADVSSNTPVARLLVISRGKTVSERGLYPGRLIVGRASDADLRIDSLVISRHHCQILTSNRLCVLEDLNSSNGVFIKNQRVRRHNLNDGDVVSLGMHQLMYIDERPGQRLGTDSDTASTGSHAQPAPVGEATQN